MTLVPVKPHQPAKNVDPGLLDDPVAVMIDGRYGWREYCNADAAPLLLRDPERKHRTISLYEILTALRPYQCAQCGKHLWDPNVKEDI